MHHTFDAIMCFFWVVTYLFVLIGTMKYRYPVFPLAMQFFTLSNELAVLLYFVKTDVIFNYAVAAYLCWGVLEIAILIAIARTGFYKTKHIVSHFVATIAFSGPVFWLLTAFDSMLFICYFFAFFGELFWFVEIFRKNYPIKAITLMAFVSKFLADGFAVPVYFNRGYLLIDCVCVLLPLIDLAFIVIWFVRRKQGSICAESK